MRARVSDEPWLTSPATRRVVEALEAAGGRGCVRFVGGCVRNALMGRPIDDIDLATRLEPKAAMGALLAAGLKVIPTGLAHGTVTAVSGGAPYEVTTLRRDVSTDGRNATVAFTEDWAEDAARRDFRLNALYADGMGAVFDPIGHGVDDALEGRIVFVGEPEVRIREDYLRILRFFRFFAWYGRGGMDEAGLAACGALKDGLSRLSAERVSRELLKLLAAPDPRPAVRAMIDSGVMGRVLPEVDAALFEAMCAVSDDPVLRLSALLPADVARVRAIADALRLSNAQKGRLVAAIGEVALDGDAQDARTHLYRIGRPAFEDRVRRAEAAARSPGGGRRLLDIAATWAVPRLPVGGREITAAGVAPGPDTGRVLKAFEEDWIAADFPDHGQEDRLRAVIAALDPPPVRNG